MSFTGLVSCKHLLLINADPHLFSRKKSNILPGYSVIDACRCNACSLLDLAACTGFTQLQSARKSNLQAWTKQAGASFHSPPFPPLQSRSYPSCSFTPGATRVYRDWGTSAPGMEQWLERTCELWPSSRPPPPAQSTSKEQRGACT